nr:hypothetical protein [Tanacetum cinerariifolium]
MATTLDQQVALDEALVPSAQRKHVLDLEAFREMLHISPRISGQSFAELPFEEEILEFLRFLRHSTQIKTLTDVNINKLYQPWRSFAVVINKCLTGSLPSLDETELIGITSGMMYCSLQSKWSRQEMHISQQRGSGIDEGTGSRPGFPDVPSDDSEEELHGTLPMMKIDNDADDQDEAEKVNDADDDEEEITKIGEQEVTESDEGDDEATESDRESEDEETREQEEESFDLIPRTPKDNDDDDNNEEDQGLRIGEEERMQEEEDAEELYRDVDINHGRGLQVSQETEDSHVILTPTQSDAQQESSSTSSFMTNLLNPIPDPGLDSLFTTGSTTITPIPSPKSTMTPSIISTFTLASQLPAPPTQIPSLDLQSLPTFASVFLFEDRVKSLEDNFSNILGIVNQYMHQQMPKAVREAVQTQTNRLQDSIQRENDEFLKTIDENMKKIIKEQVKTQVKPQVTRILPIIEEAVNAQLEAKVLTRSSHSLRTSYAVAAKLLEMELKKILIHKMEGNKSIHEDERMMIRKDPSLDQTGGEEKEGSMHQLALHLNQLPGVQADLPQGLNLDSCLPVSLLLQRNLCRLPVRWRNPHIRCLKQVQKINPLFKLLSILNGFPSQGDHQHRIMIGTNLCQLLKETLNHG